MSKVFREKLVAKLLQVFGNTETPGTTPVLVLEKDQSGFVTLATGVTVPTDAEAGYAKGAIFIDTNQTAGLGARYENLGTTASALFRPSVDRSVASAVGAGNGETIVTNVNVSFYDPAGSRTGVILQAGTYNGQQVTVVNIADAAETITFAAEGTSNVAEGTAAVIQRYESIVFTWHVATLRWYGSGE